MSLKSRSIPARGCGRALARGACTGCRRRAAGSSSSSTARPSTRRPKAISARRGGAGRRARRQGRRRLPSLPGDGTHRLSGASVRRRPAAQRVGDAEPSADADDRRRHPPLAAPPDPVPRSATSRPTCGAGAEAIGGAARVRGSRRDAGDRRRGDGRGPRPDRPSVRGRAAADRWLGDRARARRELHRRGARRGRPQPLRRRCTAPRRSSPGAARARPGARWTPTGASIRRWRSRSRT